MEKLRRILFSKLGWAFVFGHAVLFAYALFLRGGPFHAYHAYYEPWLLHFLVLLDIAWFFAIGLTYPYNGPMAESNFLVVLGSVASIQWLWIGYLVEQKRKRDRTAPQILEL